MRLRRYARASAVVAGLVIISTALGAGLSEAAPGGDAQVVAKTITVDTSVATPSGSATVMCPTGTRATGGGAAPVSPIDADGYRIQASGPVDSSGLSVNTDTGDIPRGWLVTVSQFQNFGTSSSFHIYALCSRDSDAVVQSLVPAGPFSAPWTFTAVCPAGMRALSGGAMPVSPIPNGEQDYLFHQSNPVDAGGTTSGTVTGDVATGWLTTVDTNGGGSGIPHFFAVCSAKSDAKVQSADLVVPAGTQVVRSTTVSCPSGRRVVGGGLGVDNPDINDRVEYAAPIGPAGTVSGTKTGDIAKKWTAAGRTSNTTSGQTFRVMLLCAGSERRPDALVKRSNESAYVGQNVYYPTSQIRAWSARRTQTRAFTLRFENDGDTDGFKITGCHTHTAYVVTYINPATGANVTSKVTSSTGFVFTGLAHNAVRTLVLRLRPTKAATIGSVPTCRVVATSRTVTTLHDAVTAKVKVVKG